VARVLRCGRATVLPARDGDGFTLIEMIIVSAIVPMIVGGLALALVALLSLQHSVASRVSDAADAQTVSAYYEQDVESASDLTTSATVTQCGTGTQLLGLEWNLNQQTGQYQSVVSYIETADGTGFSLVRRYCAAGASTTPTTSVTVSDDIPSGQPPPSITPTGKATAASVGWVSAVGVTSVTLGVTEPGSAYNYTLVAVPRASSSSGQLSGVAAPTTTSCGFTTPGTGTYSSTLCFVDFTKFLFSEYNNATAGQQAQYGTCQNMTAAVANTPYTLSFCLRTTTTPATGSVIVCPGGNAATAPTVPAVAACPIPTYFDPPTSEAFLGNNGFYTGISGNPALYQNEEGSTSYVYITNIELTDSNGNAATGWELVTGDAESTDAGESLTWTTDSGKAFSLLPDSSSSEIGNACADPGPGAGLTGVGTNSVECAASVNSDKTGTVMLEVPSPKTLTAEMVGAGLEAIFVGVLLP
jgi:prepilin-type N-terminal cleavage/methylation domain-containing protein